MKNLLIIYPHWHPANLAGVHRPRLIGNFLPDLGWQPLVLTVKEEYFEEDPDPDFQKTFRPHFEVIRTNAFPPPRRMRLVGDIGLRAFFQLYRKGIALLKERAIDFIWIPIPSFYMALLGRLLHDKTGVPYGIDYIDPWVRPLAPYQKKFSRAWWSLQLAKRLEPIAVKKAALISGVSTSYYQAVLDRNFKNQHIAHVGMPYGFDPDDHTISLEGITYPWSDDPATIPYVYAGAFLPQSYQFMEGLFQVIKKLDEEGQWDQRKKMFFLGTGRYGGTTIQEYAAKYGVDQYVTEIRERFPFLHIQQFLRAAQGVLIIGSTEQHYTASKTFQCLLSGRPVWAIFHKESSAAEVMSACKADRYLSRYEPIMDQEAIVGIIKATFTSFLAEADTHWAPDLHPLDQFSAKKSAEKLVEAIEFGLQNTEKA